MIRKPIEDRYQGMILVQDNLYEVVTYLRRLEEKLKGPFDNQRKTYHSYEVGVDIHGTSENASTSRKQEIIYMVNARLMPKKRANTADLLELIRNVEPRFVGSVSVGAGGNNPYPVSGLISLCLLEDMLLTQEHRIQRDR
jgi:hypothetical protein